MTKPGNVSKGQQNHRNTWKSFPYQPTPMAFFYLCSSINKVYYLQKIYHGALWNTHLSLPLTKYDLLQMELRYTPSHFLRETE